MVYQARRGTEKVNYQSMECHEEVQKVMGICNRQTSPMLGVREAPSQPPLGPGRYYAQEDLKVNIDDLDRGRNGAGEEIQKMQRRLRGWRG